MSTRDRTIRNTLIGLVVMVPVILLTYFGVIPRDSFLGSNYHFFIGFAVVASAVQVYARGFMKADVHIDR
jgi:hypothetical protein